MIIFFVALYAAYTDGRGLSTPAKSNAVPNAIVAGSAALLTVDNALVATTVPVVSIAVPTYSIASVVSVSKAYPSYSAYYIAGSTTASSTAVKPLYI